MAPTASWGSRNARRRGGLSEGYRGRTPALVTQVESLRWGIRGGLSVISSGSCIL